MRAETLLRQAAVLMRTRAEAATSGPWFSCEGARRGTFGVLVEDSLGDWLGNIARQTTEDDADHIASWHPAVALAVADWLDGEAHDIENHGFTEPRAVAVARAYLGDGA